MEDKIRESLDEVIEREIRNLSMLKAGTEEKTEAVKDLTELYKLRIEEAKIEQEKAEAQKKARSQTYDRLANFGVTAGLGLLNIIVFGRAFKTSIYYDQNGVIPSPMTRNLFSRMMPRK